MVSLEVSYHIANHRARAGSRGSGGGAGMLGYLRCESASHAVRQGCRGCQECQGCQGRDLNGCPMSRRSAVVRLVTHQIQLRGYVTVDASLTGGATVIGVRDSGLGIRGLFLIIKPVSMLHRRGDVIPGSPGSDLQSMNNSDHLIHLSASSSEFLTPTPPRFFLFLSSSSFF